MWAEDGRKLTGKLVAVGGGKLEIRRPPRFPRLWGADRRDVFPESSVRRIEHRDSTTVNGGLIGFAAGLAAAVAVFKTVGQTSRCEDLCQGVVVLGPVFGPIIGAAIDGAINRTLFISPTLTKAVAVRPELGRGRAVVSASLRF